MMVQVLPIDPGTYRSHVLHAEGAEWTETNCSTDMWIEILHTWGLDPVAGLAFTVGTDFDGEQWTMFTYPDEDLRVLYGIEVHEMNVWRPLLEHVEEHLRLGQLVAVDVDAYFLPDTAGVTYRHGHQKTTVTVQALDRARRRMGYFHNGGYAALGGDDFDGIFHLAGWADPLAGAMPPFVLTIRLDGVRHHRGDLVDAVVGRLTSHLERRPMDNPVSRLGKRVGEELPEIRAGGVRAFHRYAFGTCRHLGANGALAAAFVGWLADRLPSDADDLLTKAVDAYGAVSKGAKVAEFTLARAAAGRRVDLPAVFTPLEEAWERAGSTLDQLFGSPSARRPGGDTHPVASA